MIIMMNRIEFLWLSVRPSEEAIAWVKVEISWWNEFLGTQGRLVLQLMGFESTPKKSVNRKHIKFQNRTQNLNLVEGITVVNILNPPPNMLNVNISQTVRAISTKILRRDSLDTSSYSVQWVKWNDNSAHFLFKSYVESRLKCDKSLTKYVRSKKLQTGTVHVYTQSYFSRTTQPILCVTKHLYIYATVWKWAKSSCNHA